MTNQHDDRAVSLADAPSRRRSALFAGGLAALALAGGLAGCYERVVNARGLGADQYSVSESYQESDGKIDSWLFGPPAQNKQRQGSLLDRR